MQLTDEAFPPAVVAIGGVLLGVRFSDGAIAWLPELGRVGNKALAALVGVRSYDAMIAASIEAKAARRVVDERSATCSIRQPWLPPPAIIPSLRPTFNGCGPRAKRPKSPSSPAYAS